jgi:hypothetical protein
MSSFARSTLLWLAAAAVKAPYEQPSSGGWDQVVAK